MKSWMVSVALALLITLCHGYPVALEDESHTTASDEDKNPSVFEEYEDEVVEPKVNNIRSISSGNSNQPIKDPSAMISKALEDVSETLGSSFKNLGTSAIQILEGTGVAAEQALGTGARIVTGVAETAAEAAETGAKSAIRIAHGVANSLTQGTRSIVETKTNLLKGLTGGSSLLADASSNSDTVQRQERQSYGGYSSTSSYGSSGLGDTPNNFVNVFSQAAANTVNFGTQLLNSLVGVAANILQGTVSTLLSLLNAKGQVVGAIVQSAPPVLASVTRTAGDVLAAKARIFGAVTQAAVSFGSQLARTFGDTFGGLFNRINNIGGNGDSEGTTPARGGLGGILAALGGGNKGSSEGGLGGSGRGLAGILASLQQGGSRDSGSSQGSGLLGGIGNLAQTLLNAKLNLVNGLLSPFTGGRSLINLGNRNYGSSLSNGYSGSSESNFRISIASTPSSNPIISLGTDDSSSTGPRTVRFFVAPDATFTPKLDTQLSGANLLSSFSSGIFKGFVDQLNSNLQASLTRNAKANGGKGLLGSFDSSGNYATKTQIIPPKRTSTSAEKSSKETTKISSKEQVDPFSKILPKLYATSTPTPAPKSSLKKT